MTGVVFDVDGKTGHFSAQSLRTDSGGVDFFEDLFFQFRIAGIGIDGTHFAEQGVFCHVRRLFHRSADADSDNGRRAGVAACGTHSIYDKVDHPLTAVRGLEHFYGTHIFRTAAFRGKNDFDFIAGNQGQMDHRRGIVGCIFAVKQRIGNNGFPQIEFLVSGRSSRCDRSVNVALVEDHVGSEFHKENREPRILTDGKVC